MLTRFELHRLLIWFLLLGLILGIGWVIEGSYRNPNGNTLREQIGRENAIVDGLVVSHNALIPISPIEFPHIQVLASKIVECENPSGNPLACNQQYGCIAGMGDFQLIPSTVLYCEEKLGRHIDPFIKEDNHACGMWLLENEGSYHWGTKDTWWGSWKCWKDLDR